MTIDEITEAVSSKKETSRRQVQRYLKACEIKPIGPKQRPQRYPENSAQLILEWLGLGFGGEVSVATARYRETLSQKAARLPSMNELRASRKKARVSK